MAPPTPSGSWSVIRGEGKNARVALRGDERQAREAYARLVKAMRRGMAQLKNGDKVVEERKAPQFHSRLKR